MMSLNRYVFLCHNTFYARIFTKRNCICICLSLYGIGAFLVCLNLAGIGNHSFDRKSLTCMWDRMASYPYTIVFSVTLVWIPCIVIGVCYLRIYMFLREHANRMKKTIHGAQIGETNRSLQRNLQPHIVKSMFIIYAVFVFFWAPYALLIVIDSRDSFSHDVHVVITAFAHIHASVNWCIYYKTQKRFADAYRKILRCGRRNNCIRHIDQPVNQQTPNCIRFGDTKV